MIPVGSRWSLAWKLPHRIAAKWKRRAIMHALIRYIEQYPGPYGAESSVRMTRAKHKARARSEHPSLLEAEIHE